MLHRKLRDWPKLKNGSYYPKNGEMKVGNYYFSLDTFRSRFADREVVYFNCLSRIAKSSVPEGSCSELFYEDFGVIVVGYSAKRFWRKKIELIPRRDREMVEAELFSHLEDLGCGEPWIVGWW